jgi:hypothetical protein
LKAVKQQHIKNEKLQKEIEALKNKLENDK